MLNFEVVAQLAFLVGVGKVGRQEFIHLVLILLFLAIWGNQGIGGGSGGIVGSYRKVAMSVG